MKSLFKSIPSAGRASGDKKEEPSSEKKQEKKTETKKKEKRATGPAYRVLVRPLVTEKGNDLASNGKYIFAVSQQSNKFEIAEAVERVYGIRPVKVNMMHMRGKTVRYGRNTGATSNWKKALVTLPAGKNIDVFEG